MARKFRGCRRVISSVNSSTATRRSNASGPTDLRTPTPSRNSCFCSIRENGPEDGFPLHEYHSCIPESEQSPSPSNGGLCQAEAIRKACIARSNQLIDPRLWVNLGRTEVYQWLSVASDCAFLR